VPARAALPAKRSGRAGFFYQWNRQWREKLDMQLTEKMRKVKKVQIVKFTV
jgi:hypothetical protein